MILLMFDFPCISCGLCCQKINLSPQKVHREMNSGNGVCIYLKGNLCSIYEIRPTECNIKLSYVEYKHMLSQSEYMLLNISAYLGLMREVGRTDLIDLMSTHERLFQQHTADTKSQTITQENTLKIKP